MAYCISPWISILVISSTFMKNIMSSFDKVVTVWTAEIFLREKSQLVFANRSVVSDCSCCSCTQQVRMTKILEP